VLAAEKGMPAAVVTNIERRRPFIDAASREEAGRKRWKKERESVVACEQR
jgi:hypothetical protein